jgi:hypothetical protein
MGKRHVKFLRLVDEITWRKDSDGTEYNPAQFCSLYFHHYLRQARYAMKGIENLDRHKIVALTQQLILTHWPVTYSSEEPFSQSSETPSKYVRHLNATFAYYFALEFLGTWNKELSERKHGQPFNSDNLFTCLDSSEFAREYLKHLMLDLRMFDQDGNRAFPSFLTSQLWFAIEQWGLTHLKVPAK